jgi:hypothetical protein
MFARSLFAFGLFFLMPLALEAQYLQQPRPGQQLTPAQQRMLRQQQLQQQGQGMQQGLGMQQGKGMPGMQGAPFEATGTLEAFSQGKVKMTDAAGTERIINTDKQTVVKVTGEAAVEYLKTGLCVEFKADVDGKGNVSGKVEELTIVTVSKEKPAGVFPEGGETPKAGLSVKAKKDKEKATTPATPVASKVVGHIKSVKSGKCEVQAGSGRLVKFELSEKPKISIDISDATTAASIAAKGDKVEVKGTQPPNAPNQAMAQSVTITLAETLGEPKKKGEAGKTDSKTLPKALKKKNDKAGLPAPAADK